MTAGRRVLVALGIWVSASLAPLSVLDASGQPHPSPAAARGKPLYEAACTACHGPDGRGMPQSILTTTVDTTGRGVVSNEFLYEQRLGARTQCEIKVPLLVRSTSGPSGWERGLGDVAAGLKHVLYHSHERGAIASAGGEVIFPTDKEDRVVNVGPSPGPFMVEIELRYQPIAFRWAENFKTYDAPEPRRFVGYFRSMSAASSAVLARGSVTVR